MKQKEANWIRRINISIIIFCSVFTIAVVGQIMLIINQNQTSDTFVEGVRVSQINVGGLTKQQALKEVATSLNKKVSEMNLTISYGDKQWKYKGSDFNVTKSTQTVIDEAYNYQLKLINKKNTFNPTSIVANGFNIDVAFNFLFQDIKDKMDEIAKEIEKDPVNSQVVFKPNEQNKFEYTKSQTGVKVNKEKLLKDIERQFKTNHTNMKVTVSTTQVAPLVTESSLKDKTKFISLFSTDLHNSKAGRLHNVTYALSKINGLVVKPGEEVSFNNLTSPQTVEGGYQKSIIIFNGQFVEGVGGGLCQASTTLYNALILADVEILEVSKHTLPVGYIELALDAMVSENWSDLRFKNNSQSDLYLVAYVKDERAYVEVYGDTLEEGIKLKRRSEFIRTIGHPGDKIIKDEKGEYANLVQYTADRYRLAYPREGYEAKAYLQYYKDGQLIKEKEIRKEIYEPQYGIVVEGVKEAPEGYKPKNEVEIIPAEKETSDTTSSNVSAVILKNNPTAYNP